MKFFFSLLLPVSFFGAAISGFSRDATDVAKAGCSVQLTATLTQPTEIKLQWKDSAPDVAGHVVEYANEPDGDYVILGFCPPHQSTFVHPRLVPETTFYYRVRAIFGPASDAAAISLPKELSDADYAAAYAKPEDFHWAAPTTISSTGHVIEKSIQRADSRTQAAPSDLKIALEHTTVSGFKLTWIDHANDEAGFLIEKKRSGEAEFSVCAVVEPNINSFGWIFEPPERNAVFRVRAYFYGASSNIEHLKTGKSVL